LEISTGLKVWIFALGASPREFHRVFMSEKRVSPQGRFGAGKSGKTARMIGALKKRLGRTR